MIILDGASDDSFRPMAHPSVSRNGLLWPLWRHRRQCVRYMTSLSRLAPTSPPPPTPMRLYPFTSARTGTRTRAARYWNWPAKLARDAAEAVPQEVHVAGSIPPMFGSYLPDEFEVQGARRMMQRFRRYLAPLADILIGETLGSVAEATTYLDVFSDCAAGLWLSVTLEDRDPVEDAPRLLSGEPLSESLLLIEGMRFDGLLFNCSQPEVMNDAVRLSRAELEAFTSQHGAARPMIGAYVNAFPLMDAEYKGSNSSIHQLRKDITPEAYLRYAEQWAESGADIIGGCCSISPTHIELLARSLKTPPVSMPDYA